MRLSCIEGQDARSPEKKLANRGGEIIRGLMVLSSTSREQRVVDKVVEPFLLTLS